MAKAVAVMAIIGLALLAVSKPASAEVSGQGLVSGRKLLAATDDRFNFYTQQNPNKNVMVCKTCDATNLEGATVSGTVDGGFQIYVIDSGIITRQGDGGTDNWQFRGCFTRGGNQGSIVTFTKCSG